MMKPRASITNPDNFRATLSPTSLLRPLPQIVPQVTGLDQTCGGLAGWIGSNPMMAAVGLAGLFLLLRGGK